MKASAGRCLSCAHPRLVSCLLPHQIKRKQRLTPRTRVVIPRLIGVPGLECTRRNRGGGLRGLRHCPHSQTHVESSSRLPARRKQELPGSERNGIQEAQITTGASPSRDSRNKLPVHFGVKKRPLRCREKVVVGCWGKHKAVARDIHGSTQRHERRDKGGSND